MLTVWLSQSSKQDLNRLLQILVWHFNKHYTKMAPPTKRDWEPRLFQTEQERERDGERENIISV